MIVYPEQKQIKKKALKEAGAENKVAKWVALIIAFGSVFFFFFKLLFF